MQRSRTALGLLTPLALLLSLGSPTLAQQRAPSEPEVEADKTRELEAEIEQYPGPNDGLIEELDTRIPEEVQPRAPQAGDSPASPRAPDARASSARSAASVGEIDPRQIQRVFGRDAQVVALDTLEPAQVARLQTRLREQGHYLGAIDGIVGPKTQAALQALLQDQLALSQRLLQQNKLTTELAARVGLEPATLASPPPAPVKAPRAPGSVPSWP